MDPDFRLLSEIRDIEAIATRLSIRELGKLKRSFGGRRWRKLKGVAVVEFPDGSISDAEVHWYEAHGVGRRKMKVKRRIQ